MVTFQNVSIFSCSVSFIHEIVVFGMLHCYWIWDTLIPKYNIGIWILQNKQCRNFQRSQIKDNIKKSLPLSLIHSKTFIRIYEVMPRLTNLTLAIPRYIHISNHYVVSRKFKQLLDANLKMCIRSLLCTKDCAEH
jgi:hypothetical protein